MDNPHQAFEGHKVPEETCKADEANSEKAVTPGHLMAVSLYTAVTLTVISFCAVAIYKVGRDPARFNLWFHSDTSRRHAIAGCLLMFGFFLPVALRGVLEPTTVIVGALSYAFLFVPLASGIVSPRPIVNYTIIFIMWLFHTALTMASFVLFILLVVFKWGPAFYLNTPKLQNAIKQILFFLLCKNWLCPLEANSYLHLQIFALFKLLQSFQQIVFNSLVSGGSRDESSFNSVQSFATFLITLTALGLSLRYYVPEVKTEYLMIAIVYFALTEIEIVPNSPQSHPLIRFMKFFHIWYACELEFLLVPTLIDLSHIFMSSYVFWKSSPRYLLLASGFTNVYHPWKTLKHTWLYCLKMEIIYLKNYTLPKKEELSQFEGDNDASSPCCPVCLEVMHVCRKTPCGHLFHWSCFRRCYLVSKRCPICRTELRL